MSAIATPTAADAACRFSSAWRTSGRCSISFEGRLTGRSVGKVRSIQAEGFRRFVRRQPTEQCGQGVARLTELLLQRRQRLRGLRLRGLLGENIQIAGGAERALLLHLVGQLMLQLEQPLGRRDLAAQRGLLHRRDHHVAAQGQVGGLELEASALDLRLRHFDRAPRAAEHIGQIAHAELGGVQIVVGVRLRKAGRIGDGTERVLGSSAAEVPLDVREEAGPLRRIQLMRLPQRRLRGADVRIGLQRLLDQMIELRATGTASTTGSGYPCRRRSAARRRPCSRPHAVSPCAGALP